MEPMMNKKTGVFLTELVVAIMLVSFLVVSIYKGVSNINSGYEIADKNTMAIFLGESVKNWVKLKLDEAYTIDNLPLDEAEKLLNITNARIHFSQNTEKAFKFTIKMKQGDGYRLYNFEVPINE
jgi:hypothetical protein